MTQTEPLTTDQVDERTPNIGQLVTIECPTSRAFAPEDDEITARVIDRDIRRNPNPEFVVETLDEAPDKRVRFRLNFTADHPGDGRMCRVRGTNLLSAHPLGGASWDAEWEVASEGLITLHESEIHALARELESEAEQASGPPTVRHDDADETAMGKVLERAKVRERTQTLNDAADRVRERLLPDG